MIARKRNLPRHAFIGIPDVSQISLRFASAVLKVHLTRFFSLAKVKLRNIYITLTLYKHACKTVCDVNPGIDAGPSEAQS